MIQFPHIDVPTATDIVEQRMLELVLCAQLRPGESLPAERDIGTQSGISRTTIRQALSRLRVSGLIQREQSGYLVNDLLSLLASRAPKKFRTATVGDALHVWHRVAQFCIETAREKSQAGDITRIETAIAELQQKKSTTSTHAACTELWMAVADCGHNVLALHCFYLLTRVCDVAWQDRLSHVIDVFDSKQNGESIWTVLMAFADQLKASSSVEHHAVRFSLSLEPPVSTQTDLAFQALSRAIAEGRLAVGKKLPSVDVLAKRFAASPNAMRLALHQAESLGLIELVSQKDAVVVAAEAVDPVAKMVTSMCADPLVLDSIFEFRSMFERWSAELATHALTDEQMNRLESCLTKMDKCDPEDTRKFSEHDIRFHREIAIATGNSAIAAIQGALGELFFIVTQRWIATHQAIVGSNQEICDQHWRIQQEFRKPDAEKAGQAMFDHLDYVRHYLSDQERTSRHQRLAMERQLIRA